MVQSLRTVAHMNVPLRSEFLNFFYCSAKERERRLPSDGSRQTAAACSLWPTGGGQWDGLLFPDSPLFPMVLLYGVSASSLVHDARHQVRPVPVD